MKLYIIQRVRFERRMNQCRSYPWKSFGLAVEKGTDLKGCKENGPRAIWLNEFWCLMINTTCELMCLLVFMFIVHRMRRGLD
jgi:hypothetical protein